ncbi:ComEA family DNA-binding protein [Stenoxybacter acetivorans]|uniref:ComEA family DNA-binding protein n=1 Tax=Stenoxybacter acetivorans TaxID=422441 RepID=UPI0005626670|nr:helix-hairpin-helix domain-containing protein [Stenoxybacter acetivorans]
MKKFLFVIISLLSLSWALAGVNINTATVQELQTLPGIGASKAQAIVDYRNEHGSFASAEDITKVKGIGSGIFQKLKDEIEVNSKTAPADKKAKPATAVSK